MAGYEWKPIEPISERDRTIDLGAIQSLYEAWQASKARLQESSPASLSEFNARLIRRLSVETGILERIYDLDRGTTEALVASGFAEELVSSRSTDIDPSRLIDILRDQESAIQLVMKCVSGKRDFTRSVMHEIHAVITRHQETVAAIDQFGNRLEIPLQRGKFKEHPNNPTRPDGFVHEYCPPVQVDSEIDNLFAYLSGYTDEDPVIVAAWFHHRFTQIHPYQDGNGRVARVLATLILLRAQLLPLVIDRDLRVDYLTALESADAGDLTSLAVLFASLERGAILRALSIDVDAEVSQQRTLTAALIENLADKFSRRHEKKRAELAVVNDVAEGLRLQASELLQKGFDELKTAAAKAMVAEVHVSLGGPDYQNSYWYKFEVVKSANESGKYANFNEPHYFVKASIRAGAERLVFVTSFHHVGREATGIMEATTFARLESFEYSDERESVSEDFFLCSLEPFVYTFKTSMGDIEESFARWLDQSLAIAIKEFGDRL